jgi:Ca2+-transporting ATPase
VHVPIAGMALLPLLFGLPLVLAPVHIVFLELIIDPACSIVFEAEPEEPNSMKRPPRRPDAPLFSLRTLLLSLLQGVVLFLAVAAVYGIALQQGRDADEVRALTFSTLVIGNLGLILANRSGSGSLLASLRTPNPALWWVMGGTLGFLAFVLYVPGLRELFGFTYLHMNDVLLAFAAGVTGIGGFEWFKCMQGRKTGKQQAG